MLQFEEVCSLKALPKKRKAQQQNTKKKTTTTTKIIDKRSSRWQMDVDQFISSAPIFDFHHNTVRILFLIINT